MAFKLQAFLLVLLSAPLSLALQTASRAALQLREIHPNVESEVAQNRATDARKQLLFAQENALKVLTKAQTDSSPAVKAQADEAQKQVAAAQQAAEDAQKNAKALQAGAVSQQEWSQMQSVLQADRDRYETSMKRYSALAASLVLAGILLALVAAISGFLRKSIAAGILSIVVSGVVGVPKVFPISQRAEYYRALFGQSSNLLVQSQLRLNPTESDYNEFVRGINTLSDFETNKFPSSGDVAQSTESLIKDIAASTAK
jgi:uncharacterized membrane-anchored protein